MKNLLLAASLILAFLLTGCTTFHLSEQSLVEQFANASPEQKLSPPLVMMTPRISIFFQTSVRGNDLRMLKCLDKNGNEITIDVTNHTGIRITKLDNSRTTFYFDTLLLQDSTITGNKTHFFNAHITPIKFSDIAKIEIQK